MARLVSLSGKVSHLSQADTAPQFAHRLDGRGNGPRALSFLVNDQPARYEGYPIVGEGDLVTVAGLADDGVVRALAIRNRSTGVDDGGASAMQYLLIGAATLLGLLTVTLDGLGLLFFALAVWAWNRLRRSAWALTMVRTSDTRAPAAVTGHPPGAVADREGSRGVPAQCMQTIRPGLGSPEQSLCSGRSAAGLHHLSPGGPPCALSPSSVSAHPRWSS